MIIELDYVLGCFLSRWFRHPVAGKMLFKGGTCLRKCYFPDYRFSEDVDITAEGELDARQVSEAIGRVAQEIENAVGVDMMAQPPRIETVDADPSSLYVEARLYFRGPLQRTGWPQGIRIDISTGERLVFAGVRRQLNHPYSDAAAIGAGEVRLPCYDLREALLEKLRGLSGQRRFAIARDLYHVNELLHRAGLRLDEVIPHVYAKFAVKGIELSPQVIDELMARRDEFENDWSRNLERLVSGDRRVAFGEAWGTAVRAVSALVERSPGRGGRE
ncbi:MAG: nucleotidyl transferase AbiEii/AbiGii toxin family protein [Chloroflexota bacterium]